MLKDIPFFANLSQSEIDDLAQICSEKSYEKGEFLFFEGDEPKWLNILLKGEIKIYKSGRGGREIFLHTLEPVSFVAEIVNFEQIKYPASAIFSSNSLVLQIDYAKFQSRFLSDPKICLNLIKSLSSKLMIMNEILSNHLVLKSDARVAKFIVENKDAFGLLKNVQIASILNLAPETLSRIIAEFRQKNLVIFSKDLRIEKLDESALREIYE